MEYLREFFNRYEAALNEADAEQIAQLYTDQFIATSPDYCMCNRNDDEFRDVLASTARIYRDSGMQAIRINSYAESPLDSHFYLVQIEWKLFRENGRELVDFDNTYLVRVIEGIPKIALLIADNEQQRMREQGLLPG